MYIKCRTTCFLTSNQLKALLIKPYSRRKGGGFFQITRMTFYEWLVAIIYKATQTIPVRLRLIYHHRRVTGHDILAPCLGSQPQKIANGGVGVSSVPPL
jgi:hypothetical protein